MNLLRVGLFLAGAIVSALALGCTRSDRVQEALWSELTLEGDGVRFEPGMVEGMPEPAQRFLLRSIAPGTHLARSVELEMSGDILLAPDRDPLPMVAQQILAPPEGFIWRAQTRGGVMRIRGFDRYADGEGKLLWRLFGFLPVMRASGEDVTRSAAARLAMEAVLLPSALLPGRGVEWEAIDSDRARFRMSVGPETVVTTLVVDPEGRPLRASALRWRSEGAAPPTAEGDGMDSEPGYALFGVEMSGDLERDGYTIPARIEAGWWMGEEGEFRFFRATLERVVFR